MPSYGYHVFYMMASGKSSKNLSCYRHWPQRKSHARITAADPPLSNLDAPHSNAIPPRRPDRAVPVRATYSGRAAAGYPCATANWAADCRRQPAGQLGSGLWSSSSHATPPLSPSPPPYRRAHMSESALAITMRGWTAPKLCAPVRHVMKDVKPNTALWYQSLCSPRPS